jgi:hypothetical protein
MPSWKKVITSGSDASLNSLTVTNGITGSLFGTASFATSASYAVSSSQALTASFLGSTTNAFVQSGNSFGTTATLGTNDNQSLALETSGSERMRITSAGNVGIGTTTPFSKFTTYGALSTSTSQISVVNSEGGHIILRTGISGVSNNGLSLISADVAGTNQNTRLVVSSTGNVGIGTTTPNAKLQVVGLVSYADNAAAIAGGLTVGAFYHTSGTVKVVI